LFDIGLVPLSLVQRAFVVITWPCFFNNPIFKVILAMLGTIILYALHQLYCFGMFPRCPNIGTLRFVPKAKGLVENLTFWKVLLWWVQRSTSR
jgi:hypothetical protein